MARTTPIARRDFRGSAAAARRRSELEVDEGTGVTGGEERDRDEQRGGDGEARHIGAPRKYILLLRRLHVKIDEEQREGERGEELECREILRTPLPRRGTAEHRQCLADGGGAKEDPGNAHHMEDKYSSP